MVSRHFLYGLAVCFMVLTSGPAQALAAIDQQGAARLHTLFRTMLDRQVADAKSQGGDIVLDGDILVEPSDSYYAVTLPHITARAADGAIIEIGIVSVNAMPGDAPDQWKMTVAFPTPLIYTDPDNVKITISIGKQNFAGIWHETFDNFVKLKAQYKDIAIASSDGLLNATLPDFTILYDLSQKSAGRWSGPMAFTAAGFNMKFIDGGQVQIGKLSSNINIIDYDVNEAASYREKMDALSESYNAGEDSLSGAHATGLFNMLSQFLGKVWDGFTMTGTVENLVISGPSKTQPGVTKNIRLGKAGFGFDMTGFRQNRIAMRLAMDYSGLAMTPSSPEIDETTPTDARVEISLRNLPYQELVKLGSDSMAQAAQMPQMAQMVGLQALMTTPQLLTQAGTTLHITNTMVGNKDYHIKMNAEIKTDMNALKGGTGAGMMEIRGLDKLIAAVQKRSANPSLPPPEREKMQKLLTSLTVLQLAGQQGTNSTGEAVRTYNFALDQQGKVTMNGTDIQLLLNSQPQGGAAP